VQSCETAITFDRQAGTYSLRIAGLNIAIPADYNARTKDGRGKQPTTRLNFGLLQYTDIPLKNSALLLSNRKGTPEAMEGSVVFASAAPSEKRNGTPVGKSAPNVTTTIEWRLTLQ